MSSKTTSKLLIDESPLVILPSLAEAIGLNESIFLQQLNYLLQDPRNGKVVNGVRYIYNTYAEWKSQYFRFWSETTIKRIIRNLENLGLVKSVQAEKTDYDHRKFYVIDYNAFDRMAGSLESLNREKSGKGSSHRSDQNDPLDGGQCGPFSNRQRVQQRMPPTPRQEPGGSISSFPGKDTPEPVNVRGEPTDPVKAVPGLREWAKRAEAIPGADEFLAIAGLHHFPNGGRQSLARCFVNAHEAGRISTRNIKLVAAVRDELPLPRCPEELIANFADVTANAAEVVKARIQEIRDKAETRHSDTLTLLRELAAAECQSSLVHPKDLCDPDMHLLFPRWLLMTCFIKKGGQEAVDAIKEQVKPHLLEELASDTGVAPFLSQIGVPLQALGVEEAEIEATRNDLVTQWKTEIETLERLLSDEESPLMSPASLDDTPPATRNE